MEEPLPSDTEIEQHLIGHMIAYPDRIDEIRQIVSDEDLIDEANQVIFRAVVRLHEKGRIPADALAGELRKTGEYEVAGGAEHVLQCVQWSGFDWRYYAETLRDLSIRRGLIEAAAVAIDAARDVRREPAEALAGLDQRITRLTDRGHTIEPIHAQRITTEFFDVFERRLAGESIGLKTGYVDLDNQLGGGMRAGELLILAARPGMGKTSLALNITQNVAIENEGLVMFASLEMSRMELCERMLSSVSGINGYVLRNVSPNEDQKKRIQKAAGDFANSNTWIIDQSQVTARGIAVHARRAKRRKGLSVVIVDYLQLLEPLDYRVPREQQVAEMTRTLKALARELEIPVLCLAQLNRKSDDSAIPRLNHLRESGAIEQDADVVMFVHRDEYYKATDKNKGLANIFVAKNRNGHTGKVELVWKATTTRFETKAPERHREFDEYSGFNPKNAGYTEENGYGF